MNCGDCILLRAALRNRRSRLLFANYILAFRAFSRSKNLTAVYAYRKAQETQYSGNSARNLKSFFGDVFSQDKENERRRISVLQAKFDAVFGKLSPNLKSFFGDVFRKTRKMSADVQAYFKRNLTQYSEKPARTSNHFSAMFFRKTRKMSDGVLSVLRAKFDAVFGKLSPKPQLIFRRCFFRKTRLLSRRCMCIPQGARNAVLREKLSPNLSTFFGDVFSQDKENKRRRTSVLQAKFDTVLRKNSPKNQISIMSASFFFAISSISLTYLSVIF